MSKPAIVYGLTSSEDGQIRYIGQTTKPLRRRLREHITSAQRGGMWPIAKWIRKVIRQGFEVQITPLVESAIWDESEIETITTYLAQGAKLLNATNGGKGFVGMVFTEDTRRKMSEAAKRRLSAPEAKKILAEIARKAWTDPVYRQRKITEAKARLSTPEARARLSEQSRRAFQDSDVRQRQRAGATAAAQQPSLRERRRAIAQRLAQDPDHRRKISDGNKRKWQDPEFRQKMQAAIAQRSQNQALKAQIAQKVTTLWQDLAYRARTTASAIASWTPEKRARQAKTLSGRTLPRDHRQHISDGLRQHYTDPAVRARRTDALKQAWVTRRQRQAPRKEA
jgi:hypothetical protein